MDGPIMNPFWNHVEEMNDGSRKCRFCGHSFAGRTSISRIKWHFSGEKGHGVAICGQVPKHIQEGAFKAMRGGNKRHKTVASSSNNGRIFSTSPREESIKVEILENLAGEETMHVDESVLSAEWRIVEQPIAAQLSVEDVEAKGRLVHPVADASSSRQHPCSTSENKGDAMPGSSMELVGQQFVDYKNMAWSWLMNNEVSLVGIYGMGGVGKSSLVKHIYNQLKERLDICDHVYWISVPQDFSIYELQKHIAKRIALDLSNEDEMLRAQELSEALVMKKQTVLIFDDLWASFDPEKVGIPIQKKGCKLILTTRSLKVCRRMGCLPKIKVEPLSQKEAWTLFMQKLMPDAVLSPEVEQIAKSVSKECAGLPLGIITLAVNMRGVDDIHEWRNVLEKLKGRDMEDEVFQSLRFSYDQLHDFALQQCFLYCALFPKDYEIERIELISYLIDEGIIEGMKSRQAEFDEGHTMLNKLENVCLLERCSDGCAVKMHDLLRDMALQLQQENSQVMIMSGSELIELPDLTEWTEDLVRAALMRNKIEEIPSSHPPRCPNLSTVFLQSNERLRFISDSFFKQLHGLKVLDLSDTKIKILPDSISDLVGLIALLLKHCWKLRHVPSLEKLRLLRRLDLRGTPLKNMPQGMECLSSLRYLRLHGCGQKKFPIGTLPKLSQLQVFILEKQRTSNGYPPVTVEGKEVACLRKLETLKCHFEHPSDLVEYLKSWNETRLLSSYCFFVGQWDKVDYKMLTLNPLRSKKVVLSNLSIKKDREFQVMFPNDVKELIVYKCNDARSSCDVSSPIHYAIELEVIQIWNCFGMESLLFSSPLEPLSSHSIFSSLKKLNCECCRSMKKLFPFVLLPSLINLEEIAVRRCDIMEEIMATSNEGEEEDMGEESHSYSTIENNLPKLRILRLDCLPQLKRICSARLTCNSLQQIIISNCPKLKRIPISLPILDNGLPSPLPSLEKISICPKQWWESVEWDHPKAKDILLPFVSGIDDSDDTFSDSYDTSSM